jgi:hypothetical protein
MPGGPQNLSSWRVDSQYEGSPSDPVVFLTELVWDGSTHAGSSGSECKIHQHRLSHSGPDDSRYIVTGLTDNFAP